MRVPLAPAGFREMALITLVCGGLAVLGCAVAAAGHAWGVAVAVVFGIAWLGGLAFFRDPERTTPAEPGIMVAPADGTVTEISELDRHDDLPGPARRIGIFLSVFSVHINRSPCAGVVRSIRYQRGQFLDARDVQSGHLNEANTVVIEPDEPMGGPVVVRQVAGKIARRIVCTLKVGDRVRTGQRIGLIKFGSRTELIVPAGSGYAPVVKIGDHTRGAVTIMARRTGNTGGSGNAPTGAGG